MNSQKIGTHFLIASTLLTGLVVSVASFNSQTAFAVENAKIGGNGYQCLGSETNRWKTENDNSANLPSGYSISRVVVKAGGNCVDVHPTNTASTCYSVSINGNSVTVNKIGSGSSCKDISHLEGTYAVSQVTNTPTPTSYVTPTPTCTDTPTPTPTNAQTTPTVTDTPTPTPTTGQNTPTDTPTPTPTVVVTDTPTPTPGSNTNTGESTVQAAKGSEQSSTPSVPAKSMASTGSFGSIASNASIALGVVLSTLSAGYAKKKKK